MLWQSISTTTENTEKKSWELNTKKFFNGDKNIKSSTSSAHCDETEGVLDPIVLYVVIPAVISTPSDEDVVPQIFLCGSLRESGVIVQWIAIYHDFAP